jgi:hypothetical protein
MAYHGAATWTAISPCVSRAHTDFEVWLCLRLGLALHDCNLIYMIFYLFLFNFFLWESNIGRVISQLFS